MWSDSTVLNWIQSESCNYKVFIGMQITEIQTFLDMIIENTWIQIITLLMILPRVRPSYNCPETANGIKAHSISEKGPSMNNVSIAWG